MYFLLTMMLAFGRVFVVLQNNDFVVSFLQIRRFQFVISNGGEEKEREKRNSAIQLYMCIIIQKI
jgi:hypothetical protein